MKWTVVWNPMPESDMTTSWLQADPALRKKISNFVNAVESELSMRPEHQGKILPSGLREIIDMPIGLIFEVLTEDRIVKVVAFHVLKT